MELREEFLNYLKNDQSNREISISTFIGSRKIGKSFLIDNLISV